MYLGFPHMYCLSAAEKLLLLLFVRQMMPMCVHQPFCVFTGPRVLNQAATSGSWVFFFFEHFWRPSIELKGSCPERDAPRIELTVLLAETEQLKENPKCKTIDHLSFNQR